MDYHFFLFDVLTGCCAQTGGTTNGGAVGHTNATSRPCINALKGWVGMPGYQRESGGHFSWLLLLR